MAALNFAQCLPCGDEMAIAAIYRHTPSCYRAGQKPRLLKDHRQDMKVGQ